MDIDEPAATGLRTPPDFRRVCETTPAERFHEWMTAAHASGDPEPTAMALSTLGGDGSPRLRWVLCKGWVEDGLHFYTNLHSEKGTNLLRDGRVAVAFHWPALHRQVRVEGHVEPLPSHEADAYYEQRPRLSRVGAWASRQSQPLRDRQELMSAVAAAEERFRDVDPPRPAHWAGMRIVPRRWEFWQGRAGRLHERLVCERSEGEWTEWALYP
jgi:pyridoxamine 5'-phosphate oxidase